MCSGRNHCFGSVTLLLIWRRKPSPSTLVYSSPPAPPMAVLYIIFDYYYFLKNIALSVGLSEKSSGLQKKPENLEILKERSVQTMCTNHGGERSERQWSLTVQHPSSPVITISAVWQAEKRIRSCWGYCPPPLPLEPGGCEKGGTFPSLTAKAGVQWLGGASKEENHSPRSLLCCLWPPSPPSKGRRMGCCGTGICQQKGSRWGLGSEWGICCHWDSPPFLSFSWFQACSSTTFSTTKQFNTSYTVLPIRISPSCFIQMSHRKFISLCGNCMCLPFLTFLISVCANWVFHSMGQH